jgi:predicted  nucleic acid-binding Zn ribbon protein
LYTAEISITAKDSPTKDDIDKFIALLSILYKNGQIIDGSWPLVIQSNEIRAFLSLPMADSLANLHMNQYAQAILSKILRCGLSSPFVSILGEDPGSTKECNCKKRNWMILFTHFLSIDPPLRCGNCFGYIPLYTQPNTSDHEFLDILQWQSDYKALDTLQMHCTTGEKFAEKQLFDPESSISKQGRDICNCLEKASGTPTYYYLHKSKGINAKTEQARKCPICKNTWLLKRNLFGRFDFKCKQCRLVSNIAYSLRY